MRRLIAILGLALMLSVPAAAQSLQMPAGSSGLEIGTGWSVGPSTNGIETFIGGSIGGTVDVGVQLSHYTNSEFDSSFEDYAPLVR